MATCREKNSELLAVISKHYEFIHTIQMHSTYVHILIYIHPYSAVMKYCVLNGFIRLKVDLLTL